MVRRGDRNGVDLLIREKLTQVGVGLQFTIVAIFELLVGILQDPIVDVANRDHFHVIQLFEPRDVRLAPAVATNRGHADSIVRAGPKVTGSDQLSSQCCGT